MNYQDYLNSGTIKKISFLEKKDIKLFLEYTSSDNEKTSKSLIESHSRWSIISGYYAMHDLSELYLLLKFDLQFTKPSVHDAVIKALKELVDKKEVINLIEEGNTQFKKVQKLDYFLAKGKENREKTQYYTILSFNEFEIKKIAFEFNKKVVEPYLKIIKKLIKEIEK